MLAPVRVALLSTGDEVVEPGQDLAPGQIHDANTTLLAASLAEAGAEVVRSRILADSPADFRAALRDELDQGRADLVLTSGGISKGAYEVVRLALAAEGVQLPFGCHAARRSSGPRHRRRRALPGVSRQSGERTGLLRGLPPPGPVRH